MPPGAWFARRVNARLEACRHKGRLRGLEIVGIPGVLAAMWMGRQQSATKPLRLAWGCGIVLA